MQLLGRTKDTSQKIKKLEKYHKISKHKQFLTFRTNYLPRIIGVWDRHIYANADGKVGPIRSYCTGQRTLSMLAWQSDVEGIMGGEWIHVYVTWEGSTWESTS